MLTANHQCFWLQLESVLHVRESLVGVVSTHGEVDLHVINLLVIFSTVDEVCSNDTMMFASNHRQVQ